MTAPLKRINIERAHENGQSTIGPWVVAYEESHFSLWHYGHLLAEVTFSGNRAVLKAQPRPGHGFSRSDVEGIRLLAHYAGATVPESVQARQSAYREYGMSRPFPLRPEPRFPGEGY